MVDVVVLFKKAVIFRLYSMILTALLARVWFGDWHTTTFGLVLIPFCTFNHYAFEKIWKHYEKSKIPLKARS